MTINKKERKVLITFIGPPGAGKDTQAKLLAYKYSEKLKAVSIGELLREEAKNNEYIKKLTESGLLVPDSIIVKLVEQELKDIQKDILLLTGIPRTFLKAEFLLNQTPQFKLTIYIKLSEKEIINRLSKRLICPLCGKIYHPLYHPPKKEGICDIDGAKLIKRKDDSPEIIKRRYEEFLRSNKKAIKYLEKYKKLKTVDGNLPIETLNSKIENILKKESIL